LALADAIDWLNAQLSDRGLAVQRQGFVHGDEVQQNLMVRFPGLRFGNQSIVVGARLDAASGSPGADDNASGAAVLLCLAERFRNERHLRTLDLVWFTDASARRDSAGSGARAFVNTAKKDETRVIRAMIELNGVGVYSSAANSQRYDETLVYGRSVGDFVGFLSYPEYSDVAGTFRYALETQGSLPVSRFTALSDTPPFPNAAHTEFLSAGIPAMMLFDTHRLRNLHFGTESDVADDLDYEAMARLVEGVANALLELTGPAGEAPAAPDGYGTEGVTAQSSDEPSDPPNQRRGPGPGN
jgi:Zn-dependent M28 family amino/carboxypeptidase